MQDSDGDGLPDGFERMYGLNPTDPTDAGYYVDTDQDGVPDSVEISLGGDPTNPDTDGDGLYDYIEYRLGLRLDRADSDGDGLSDFDEWYFESPTKKVGSRTFTDGELASIRATCLSLVNCRLPEDVSRPAGGPSKKYGTNPLAFDTDGDGLSDAEEIDGWYVRLRRYTESGQVDPYLVTSDPLKQDTDGDGLNDFT